MNLFLLPFGGQKNIMLMFIFIISSATKQCQPVLVNVYGLGSLKF